MQKNQERPEIMNALGLKPIDVEYPCERCLHYIDKHGDAIDLACSASGCTCTSFAGALEDGRPRALRFRQLTALEWSSLRAGLASFPMPLRDEDKEPLKEEQLVEQRHWVRAVFRCAAHSVRTIKNGKTSWRKITVLDSGSEPNYDAWQVSIDDLDRGFSDFVAGCVARILLDLFDGGPFGGITRPFPYDRVAALSPTGDDIREDAARVDSGST